MTDKRDENGRFKKGHSGGPGRPPLEVERDYLATIQDRLTMDKWTKIVDKAIRQAITGDRFAREWLGNYTIGKPPTILELRASDAQVLKEVLALLESQGLNASDVFNAMLAELAVVESEADD